MPRKQRFKPSRKPKVLGTVADLAPLDRSDPNAPAIDPARSREVGSGDFATDCHGHRDTDASSWALDLGGDSG
jgi:hypothetical protein